MNITTQLYNALAGVLSFGASDRAARKKATEAITAYESIPVVDEREGFERWMDSYATNLPNWRGGAECTVNDVRAAWQARAALSPAVVKQNLTTEATDKDCLTVEPLQKMQQLEPPQPVSNSYTLPEPFGWLRPDERHLLLDEEKANAIQSGSDSQRAQAEAFSFALYAAPPADAPTEDARLFRLFLELMDQGDASVTCTMPGDGTQPDYIEPVDRAGLLAHLRQFPNTAGSTADARDADIITESASIVREILGPGGGMRADENLPDMLKTLRCVLKRNDEDAKLLRAFASDVIDTFQEVDPDIQEMAEKHGLLAAMSVIESCGDDCGCTEVGFPTECYRKTSVLRPAIDRAMGAKDGQS